MPEQGARLGAQQQTLADIVFGKEVTDAVTIKTLRRAAEAMNCKVVYALVPEGGSLKSLIEEQALKKARELVKAVDHTMMLEEQGVGNVEEKTREVADEMASNVNSSLWD